MLMVVELFVYWVLLCGIWCWILLVCFVMFYLVVYELVEWLVVLCFGGELGIVYLGIQGDFWDVQQDMVLVVLGSVLLMIVLVLWVGCVWVD